MQQRSPTLLQWWFWLITRFIGWLFMGAFGCIVVAILIVSLRGEQVGLDYLQSLVQADSYYLQTTLTNTQMTTINHWLGFIPKNVIDIIGFLPVISQHYQVHLWMMIAPFAQAILLSMQLLILRLYLLLRWYPLFLLLGLLGVVDGLAQRYIRRVSAGRESALIYHNAKPLIMLSLLLCVFIGLILPVSIVNAEWVVVVSALLFGLAIQVTAKSFKKYL